MEGSHHEQNYGRTFIRVLPDGFSSVVRFFPPAFRRILLDHLLTSFFGEVLRIGSPDYVPDIADVLRARQKSVGITETRFTMGQLS